MAEHASVYDSKSGELDILGILEAGSSEKIQWFLSALTEKLHQKNGAYTVTKEEFCAQSELLWEQPECISELIDDELFDTWSFTYQDAELESKLILFTLSETYKTICVCEVIDDELYEISDVLLERISSTL